MEKTSILGTGFPIANSSKLTKKLYNNIYCLSHRERWEVENDWNFLYYYVTVQNFTEPADTYEQAGLSSSKIIQNYKIRFENVSKINFFSNTTKSLHNPFNSIMSQKLSQDNASNKTFSAFQNPIYC